MKELMQRRKQKIHIIKSIEGSTFVVTPLDLKTPKVLPIKGHKIKILKVDIMVPNSSISVSKPIKRNVRDYNCFPEEGNGNLLQ